VSAALPTTVVQGKIGTCPACGCGIWADVDVVVNVSDPTITEAGHVSVSSFGEKSGAAIKHACGTRDGADR
jgi:hypothetical protein